MSETLPVPPLIPSEASPTCPACSGRGKNWGFIDAIGSNGRRVGRSGEFECSTCRGAGLVPQEFVRQQELARLLADDRVKRGVSLRDQAAFFGLDPMRYNSMERGHKPLSDAVREYVESLSANDNGSDNDGDNDSERDDRGNQ